MRVQDLTQQQYEYLTQNFANTKNKDLAETLGTSESSLFRMQCELKLKKSDEFIKKMRQKAQAAAARMNRLRENDASKKNLLLYGEATRFKKGHKQRDHYESEKEYQAMLASRGKSLSETYSKERMRVRWGLPQQTNLKVTRATRSKINLRYNLRNRGYIIYRASNEAYITDETQRNERMEQRAERMGIRFYQTT